jgi:hypothetical protein
MMPLGDRSIPRPMMARPVPFGQAGTDPHRIFWGEPSIDREETTKSRRWCAPPNLDQLNS